MIRTWAIGEVPPADSPSFVASCYQAVTPYLTEFLTASHPFRNGVMCPFMPKALANKNIHFAYFDSNGSDAELQQLISSCIRFYKAKPNSAFGAVIILLEEDFDILRLLRVHIDAKHGCIKNELMIGALYKNSPAPSLHSPDYFPLRTPTPTLVLRDLTAQDLQFLSPGHYGIFSKLKFLNSFIRKFSTSTIKGYTKTRVDEAKHLRRRYRITIGIWITFLLAIIGVGFSINW